MPIHINAHPCQISPNIIPKRKGKVIILKNAGFIYL